MIVTVQLTVCPGYSAKLYIQTLNSHKATEAHQRSHPISQVKNAKDKRPPRARWQEWPDTERGEKGISCWISNIKLNLEAKTNKQQQAPMKVIPTR